MINVTKAFLPPFDEYVDYLRGVWERCHLTNNGPLVNELEDQLRSYLGVKHFFFLNNGTIALQLAIKALELKGEIITTPFSYVATTSSIVWEQAKPVFVDINSLSFTIDTSKIEDAITPQTSAIIATHVYGMRCDIEQIKQIADRHNLKVIYDAAHAFGANYNNTSVLNAGDISTLSFHATKLFHTVEGGAITTNNDDLAHRISYMRNFGHKGVSEFWGLGVNGKNSEFHAAMGLCNFKYFEQILERRKKQWNYYAGSLKDKGLQILDITGREEDYNYAYFPVLYSSEEELLRRQKNLSEAHIFARRYFYPSLNTLNYVEAVSCPVSESVAGRILCLPLFHDLTEKEQETIVSLSI